MTPEQAQMVRERDKFAADLHDAAAEMRCRAQQLRAEAEGLDRNAARLMEALYDAGVIPRPKPRPVLVAEIAAKSD